MNRPTRERVDEALEAESALRTTNVGYTDWSENEQGLFVLAAEVRALRELVSVQASHLRTIRDSHHALEAELQQVSNDRYREQGRAERAEAKLARVEALPAAWREYGKRNNYQDPGVYADEVERALKGDSANNIENAP